MPRHRKFATIGRDGNHKEWTYSGPKKGGVHSAGEHGGFYKSGEDRCLIKQDSRQALNIAEFFASRIYQHIVPEVSARIQLVRVNDDIAVSPDGSNVYLVSEFIPGWRDLYKDITNSDPSEYKRLGAFQISSRLVFHPKQLAQFFKQENQKGNYINFGQVSATSLLINNTDTNLGNIGAIVTADDEGTESKKFAVIDYGAAFRDMTAKIHPHAIKKYLSSHTWNREGWNNFFFYPESIKITPEFVAELDRAASLDLEGIVDDTFKDIQAFYGIRPIVAFAVRAGFSEPHGEAYLARLEVSEPARNNKINLIKERALNSLRARQRDLLRFSAQIKMDMCVQVDRVTKKCHLDGSFVNANKQTTVFNDVVLEHFDYFKEIILRQEKFKFRQSLHKHQPQLIQELNDKIKTVFACFLLVEENKAKYDIRDMSDAIRRINEGPIDLREAFDIRHTERVKEILLEHEQLNTAAKFQTALGIIEAAGLPRPAGLVEERLRRCKKLQNAIIELDTGCAQLDASYSKRQKNALSLYKRETIRLALQGIDDFKAEYNAIQQQAISAIDDSLFTKFARAIGNALYIILATATVVGLVTMLYSGKRGRELLLFPGPGETIPQLARRIDDITPADVEAPLPAPAPAPAAI